MNLPRVESFWQTDDDEDIWQTIIAILERLSWTDYLKNKENGNENSLYEKNEINKHRHGMNDLKRNDIEKRDAVISEIVKIDANLIDNVAWRIFDARLQIQDTVGEFIKVD